MRKILENILRFFAKAILKKQKPQIITITGSIGKTSVKEGIFCALEENFKARTNIKSYNNEIGVPLTIIGKESAGKNILGWLVIFLRAVFLSIFKKSNYPKVLVLEIGADKKGDLKYLMEILKYGQLKAAVLTAVSAAHLEALGTIEDVYKEKTAPFLYLQAGGFAVLAVDDLDIEKIKSIIPSGVKIISYTIKNTADALANNITIESRGVVCNILAGAEQGSFILEDAVAEHQLYPILAGVACGLVFNLSLQTILEGAKNYTIPKGRLRKIPGINNSLLLDDTYNSSPKAAKAALLSLKNLPYGKRKIAVLGDMLELGEDSAKYHKQIGDFAKNLRIDLFLGLGGLSKNMPVDKHFISHQEAINFLRNFIQANDVVLIKGSQGMRLEKITKGLMQNPEQAKNLLVRQEPSWLNK